MFGCDGGERRKVHAVYNYSNTKRNETKRNETKRNEKARKQTNEQTNKNRTNRTRLKLRAKAGTMRLCSYKYYYYQCRTALATYSKVRAQSQFSQRITTTKSNDDNNHEIIHKTKINHTEQHKVIN